MNSTRNAQDRRDQSGRRAMADRRREIAAISTDNRENLDRRTPYIRRVSLDRRSI